MDKEEIENLRKKLLEQVDKLPEEQASSLKEQIKNASPKQLESFVKQSDKGNECFFCQLVSGKIDTVKIYEDNDILAVLDIYPANPGHLLILPKKHFQFIYEIPDSLLNKLFLFVKTIEPIMIKITKAQGISIYIAQGQAAGQKVSHFSINLVPRFQDDGAGFEWQKKKTEKKDLEKIGKELREAAEREVKDKIEKKQKEQKKKESSEAEKISKHIKPRIP